MRTVIVVSIAIFVIAVSGFLYANKPTPNPTTPAGQIVPVETTTGTTSSSSYADYSADTFAQAAGKKKVLFFFANWCPTCLPVDKEISSRLSDIPSDTVILKVHYNDSETSETDKELAQKYGVTYQHTFVVIDDAMSEIKKWNGGGLSQLLQRVNEP